MNDRELRYTVVGPRRQGARHPARERVRDHRGVGGDGGVRAGERPAGPARSGSAASSSPRPTTASRSPPRCSRSAGAMTVIMKEAIKPNLVQTLEGQPALVHAGPFGNIAHAQQLDHRGPHRAEARRLRRHRGGLRERPRLPEVLRHRVPDRRVRAERGGARDHGARDEVARRQAVQGPGAAKTSTRSRRGADNLAAHIQIVRQYGLPCVVAINSFPTDTPAEIALVRGAGARRPAPRRSWRTTGFARRRRRRGRAGQGGRRGVRASRTRSSSSRRRHADRRSRSRRSRRSSTARRASTCRCRRRRTSQRIEKLGLGTAPVCMAKTHLSLSHDPLLRNRPTGFILPVRGLVPSAGAGFVVALCGDMQRMPGLGKTPAFHEHRHRRRTGRRSDCSKESRHLVILSSDHRCSIGSMVRLNIEDQMTERSDLPHGRPEGLHYY